MGSRNKNIISIAFSILLPFSVAAESVSSIEVVSRFWEYDSSIIQSAISNPIDTLYSADELKKLSNKHKRAYYLLVSASCKDKTPSTYQELYRYKCLNKPLSELFPASLKEPQLLLFARQSDKQSVIKYLNRYIEFIKIELSTENGMPIEASYGEYLLSIQNYLSETSSK